MQNKHYSTLSTYCGSDNRNVIVRALAGVLESDNPVRLAAGVALTASVVSGLAIKLISDINRNYR